MHSLTFMFFCSEAVEKDSGRLPALVAFRAGLHSVLERPILVFLSEADQLFESWARQ